jgi:glucosamine--fructose-6-phosphate aminotransferase (isomerizing)
VSTLFDEILQQTQSFRAMIDFYRAQADTLCIPIKGMPRLVLTGMGSSFHAGMIAALHLNRLGVPACAYEAVDLLNYAPAILDDQMVLVYISQSGSSGEVLPLIERIGSQVYLVGVTNDTNSPLAQRAQRVLPMCAGKETLVATKTYTNCLAILWMAARHTAGCADGSEQVALEGVLARIEDRLKDAQTTAHRLVEAFDPNQPLLFLGHGPHAATARQAAMIMSEWSKVPAQPFGIGAFRHGFIETIRSGFGVVIFAPAGVTQGSARELGVELQSYGARTLLVENGCLRGLEDCPPPSAPLDEFLSPVVDILPVQLYTEALARVRLDEVGFRYIGKVVSKI